MAKRNLQLVTASDFKVKLREHNCPKVVTVQKNVGWPTTRTR
ncbi:MAG: hypothetical protein OEZ44_02460 [Candidatus Bathyarchaeota archaeon]|nr:hypothetical protein [Candidatus Bathyarchaeota archaeon]